MSKYLTTRLIFFLVIAWIIPADGAIASSPHSFSGNQGQGVGNVAPGNQGSGPNATTAGKAGAPGSAGSSVTDNAVNQVKPSNNGTTADAAVSGLIESGKLTIVTPEEKKKKPKKRKPKNGSELDTTINTGGVDDVTSAHQEGNDVVLKGEESNSDSTSTTPTNQVDATTTIPSTNPVIVIPPSSTLEQVTQTTIPAIAKNIEVVILLPDDALSIPTLEENTQEVMVIDLSKKYSFCNSLDSQLKPKVMSSLGKEYYQVCTEDFMLLWLR